MEGGSYLNNYGTPVGIHAITILRYTCIKDLNLSNIFPGNFEFEYEIENNIIKHPQI